MAGLSFEDLETKHPEHSKIKQIGLRLLLDQKLKLSDLNTIIEGIPPKKLSARKFLQSLLQNRKLDVDDFLTLEKTDWTQVQEMDTPYKIRTRNGHAEFYMDTNTKAKICPKCKSQFKEDINFCPTDGTTLQPLSGSQEQTDPFLHLTIDDRYKLLELLGKGGMGSVYKARHIKLEKIVAVKILQPQLVGSKTLLTRFLREAQAASRLNHPNIIQIHDYGEIKSSVFYMAMDYVEGSSLREYLDWRVVLPVEEACYLTRQCLSALTAAHEKHLVHRDIKPANIMIVNHPKNELLAKVLDFGTAKMLDDQVDITSSVIGTPQYMSPEQAKGESVDGRSDLYSIGITLYEMVTGERPFNADTVHGYLGKHITETPIPLRKRCPNRKFSSAFESVVMKALEKNPNERYGSAQEFLNALEKAVKIPKIFYLDQEKLRQNSTEVPKKKKFRAIKFLFFTFLIFCISGSLYFFLFLPKEKQKQLLSLIQQKTNKRYRIKDEDIKTAEDLHFEKVSENYNIKLRLIREQHKKSPPKIDENEMVLIAGGKYHIGGEHNTDNPIKTKQTSGFYLDKYEVSNEQYAQFVKSTKHTPPAHWKKNSKGIITYSPQEAKLPVTSITWFDCSLYAAWAGKRLPTEWEFEIASSGKFSFDYPWGHHFKIGYANTKNSIGESSKLHPVRSHPKDVSPFGVFNMAGNVKEWMGNWYDIRWKRNRSIRGASYKEYSEFASTRFRDAFNPCYYAEDLGFRCAWDKNSN